MKLKVGDRVKLLNLDRSGGDEKYIGRTWEITSVKSSSYDADLFDDKTGKLIPKGYTLVESEVELLKFSYKNMSIKEKFALSLTPEPQKTFRKLGITNGDNLMTEEGSTIFLTWLLSQHQDAFKKEVCDDMLKEQEEESK